MGIRPRMVRTAAFGNNSAYDAMALASGISVELPRSSTRYTTFPSVTGTTRNCSTEAQVNTAISNAVSGDEIVLTANIALTAALDFTNKGSGFRCLVRSDNAAWQSASTTRVADATNMRKITSPSGGGAAITFANGAEGWYFCGIELSAHASSFTFNVVTMGSSVSSIANLPHHIHFDRCYIHGDATIGCRRGIQMDCEDSAVINSRFENCKEDGADSQAILTVQGSRNLVHNNYIEGAGENFMAGGEDPLIANYIPSDWTFTQNYFFKPTAWEALAWDVKNAFEIKNGQRFLIDGNVLENVWYPNAQTGFAVLLTPRNQSGGAPWCKVADITFRNNKLINIAQGISILGTDDIQTSADTARISIHDNLSIYNDSDAPGKAVQYLKGPDQVFYVHNTNVSLGSYGQVANTESNPDGDGCIFRDNIFKETGNLGFYSDGILSQITTLATHYTNSSFTYNAIVGGTVTGDYAATNIRPADNATVFTNPGTSDYSAKAAGPCDNTASDGLDMGCSIYSTVESLAATAIAGG